MPTPTDRDYADEAESAQRASAWPQAAALWRRLAETSMDAESRERHLKQAAWCDDMAALINETHGQP